MAYDNVYGITQKLGSATGDPNGIPVKEDTEISFDESTRTFTIQPSATEYEVFAEGARFIKTASDSVVIPNTTGQYYFYFDATGTLQSVTAFDLDLIYKYALVGIVIWDSDLQQATVVLDERHGMMQGHAHAWAHFNIKAVYRSGFAAGSISSDSSGDDDASATLSMEGGVFADEDIDHTIADGTGSGFMEQDLSVGSKAKIKMLYLDGSAASPTLKRWQTGEPWEASTSYSLGDRVNALTGNAFDRGLIFECTTAGTSGGTEPAWQDSSGAVAADGGDPCGATTTDNTVTWTCIGTFHAPVLNSIGGDYRAAYNDPNGGGAGVWGLTEVPNNDFFNIHIFATPNISAPICAILGQDTHLTLGDARDAALVEIRSLRAGDLQLPEVIPLYTLIYQTNNGYDNFCKSRIRTTDSGGDFIDWRSSTDVGIVGESTNDHAQLINIQGGTGGEYYHLTAAEYSALGDSLLDIQSIRDQIMYLNFRADAGFSEIPGGFFDSFTDEAGVDGVTSTGETYDVINDLYTLAGVTASLVSEAETAAAEPAIGRVSIFAEGERTYVNAKPWKQQYDENLVDNGDITGWAAATSLPGVLGNSQAVVTNSRVYLLGGYDGSSFASTVYTAPINDDGTLGLWTTGASLPGVLNRSQVIVTNSRVYLLGGYNGSSYVSTVYTAPINGDGTIGTWTTGTSLPGALGVSQAVVTNSRVYLLGGANGSGFASTVYTAPINDDGTLGTWAADTSLPGALGYSQAVVTDSRVYLLGGYNGSGYVSTVYTAPINGDGTIGSWTTGTSLPGALGYSQAVVTDSRVYLLGGYTGSHVSTVYTAPVNGDGTLGTWTTGTSLPGALSLSQAVVTSSRVYLLGGNDSSWVSTVYEAGFSGGQNDYSEASYTSSDFAINTDLTASVSRDGGTTWDSVTLAEVADLGSGIKQFSGESTFTSTGTSMKLKIDTANNKVINAHAWGLSWR